MRDLYLHLNIEEQCTDLDEIRSAISVCADEDISTAARHVLLVPKRKQLYDQYYRLLSTIGQLKGELRIPASPEWEALGCQDFDQEYPGDYSDLAKVLGELDQGFDARRTTRPLIRRHAGWDFDLQRVAIMVFGVALAGIILVTIVSLLGPPDEPFPPNGNVLIHSSLERNCKVEITNPGPGHVAVEVYSMDSQPILTVLVYDGLDAVTKVPQGKYTIMYSVGDAPDWEGRRFEENKKSRNIKSHSIQFTPDRSAKIRIPRG